MTQSIAPGDTEKSPNSIMVERERLLKALDGKLGFIGVRVQLGRPMKLCVDVSPDADQTVIREVLQNEHISSATDIVSVGKRHVAKPLSGNRL